MNLLGHFEFGLNKKPFVYSNEKNYGLKISIITILNIG